MSTCWLNICDIIHLIPENNMNTINTTLGKHSIYVKIKKGKDQTYRKMYYQIYRQLDSVTLLSLFSDMAVLWTVEVIILTKLCVVWYLLRFTYCAVSKTNNLDLTFTISTELIVVRFTILCHFCSCQNWQKYANCTVGKLP